ncbi:hypothetical protein EYF80_063133 [Liparis tanakae]|uniref:Uncharacterized protein n=1 Tax=Liparis tanakae TaxID=230148 RepID=A0A4Z2ED10_9TELE|nr:hypothetical protein EYF80_063133 [Liparis tanakae]
MNLIGEFGNARDGENASPELKPPGGTGESPLAPPQPSICSRLLTRANQVTVRPAAAAVAPGSINARVGPAPLSPTATATATPTPTPRSTIRMDPGTAKGVLPSQEAQKAPEPLRGKGECAERRRYNDTP